NIFYVFIHERLMPSLINKMTRLTKVYYIMNDRVESELPCIHELSSLPLMELYLINDSQFAEFDNSHILFQIGFNHFVNLKVLEIWSLNISESKMNQLFKYCGNQLEEFLYLPFDGTPEESILDSIAKNLNTFCGNSMKR